MDCLSDRQSLVDSIALHIGSDLVHLSFSKSGVRNTLAVQLRVCDVWWTERYVSQAWHRVTINSVGAKLIECG